MLYLFANTYCFPIKKLLFCFYNMKGIIPYFICMFALSFAFKVRAQVKATISFSNCIIQAKDGGYVLTGKTYPNGGDISAIYIVKLDSISNVKWTKTISGTSNEYANSIIQAKDGSYLLVGEISGDASGVDITIVKLDGMGNIKWTKSIGDMDNQYAYSIVQTKDGGFALTGATSFAGSEGENIYVAKLDAMGNVKWKKSIDGPTYSEGSSIITTIDGGYAVGGYKESLTTNMHSDGIRYDFNVVKLDSAGKVQWKKIIRGAGSKSTYSMVQTKDGGYVVTGTIDSSAVNNEDVYLVKIDAKGALQWTKTVGGKFKDISNAVVQTTDGGYAIAGATKTSSKANLSVYAIKFDASGKVVWTKATGEQGDNEGESIVQTRDGGYAISGYTNVNNTSNYKFYAVKLDSKGNVQWTKSIGSENH
jgi:hypothetical protein